jgi:hypothetical protein
MPSRQEHTQKMIHPISNPKLRLALLGIAVSLISLCFFWQRTLSLKPADDQRLNSAHPLPHLPSLDQAQSNEQLVSEGDPSILFLGNSHTSFHSLPELVKNAIQFRYPDRPVYVYSYSIGSLEAADQDPICNGEINTRRWDIVVLQAQQVSMSGKYRYSTSEGVAFAKRAKAKGARVFFYSEWGRKGIDGETERTEAIYQDMAEQSSTLLIPVGRVWQSVLAESPTLALHSFDENHQSRLGASLTALVIAAFLIGQDPIEFLEYPETVATSDQWRRFCKVASTVWNASQHPSKQ